MPTTATDSVKSEKPRRRVSRETVERNARKPHPPTQGHVSREIDTLYLTEALELVKVLGKDVQRTDPKLVMLRLVQDSFLMVQALQALVRGLEIKHLEGVGKYRTISVGPGETIRVPDEDGALADARLRLLGEWIDRSTRVASLAVRAGLEERLVDLAEAQAKHMAMLLQRFVRTVSQRLDLSAEDSDVVMEIVVEEVRRLGTGELEVAAQGG